MIIHLVSVSYENTVVKLIHFVGPRSWWATTRDTPTSRNAIIQEENRGAQRSERGRGRWAWPGQEGW